RFTGQREDATIGLYFYNARYYDPALGRFISADTVVPNLGNPQSLNRYSYVLGNPLKYTDPTGYFTEDEIKQYFGLNPEAPWENVLAFFKEGGILEGNWGWLEALRQAELGDEVSIWRGHWASGGSLMFRGTFIESDLGSLLIEGTFYGGKSDWEGYETRIRHQDAPAMGGNRYLLKHWVGPGAVISGIEANRIYHHTKFDFSEVDKVGAGYDVVGIVTNFIPESTAQSIGVGADLAAVTMGWPKFATAVATGAPFPEIADAGIDLALDLGGLLPVGGIAWDIASLAKNFGQNTRVYHGP
ncbi:MAG: hypothetical protein DRI92_05310, partial [Aquificota bacterium]